MTVPSIKHLPLWFALALPLAGCDTVASQIKASGGMGPTDADFVTAAYAIAQLDEQAGKLAATKATDPRVTDLAATMSSEATVLYPNLQGALQAEGKPVRNSLPPEVSAQLQKLGTLSGPAFDREFVAAELAAHKRAVQILQREDSTTKDAVLKAQVETELPAVQGNLDRLTFLSGELVPQKG